MEFRFRGKSGNKTFDEPSYIYNIVFFERSYAGLCVPASCKQHRASKTKILGTSCGNNCKNDTEMIQSMYMLLNMQTLNIQSISRCHIYVYIQNHIEMLDQTNGSDKNLLQAMLPKVTFQYFSALMVLKIQPIT